jgi:hypothetical protein
MRKNWFVMVPLAILAMVLITFLGGELVLHLWNWLVPSLFGLRVLTFWEALGLLALCRILFGGLGMHGRAKGRGRMDDRWQKMTPEERDRFRKGMRGRCGPFSKSDPTPTTPSSTPATGASTA